MSDKTITIRMRMDTGEVIVGSQKTSQAVKDMLKDSRVINTEFERAAKQYAGSGSDADKARLQLAIGLKQQMQDRLLLSQKLRAEEAAGAGSNGQGGGTGQGAGSEMNFWQRMGGRYLIRREARFVMGTMLGATGSELGIAISSLFMLSGGIAAAAGGIILIGEAYKAHLARQQEMKKNQAEFNEMLNRGADAARTMADRTKDAIGAFAGQQVGGTKKDIASINSELNASQMEKLGFGESLLGMWGTVTGQGGAWEDRQRRAQRDVSQYKERREFLRDMISLQRERRGLELGRGSEDAASVLFLTSMKGIFPETHQIQQAMQMEGFSRRRVELSREWDDIETKRDVAERLARAQKGRAEQDMLTAQDKSNRMYKNQAERSQAYADAANRADAAQEDIDSLQEQRGFDRIERRRREIELEQQFGAEKRTADAKNYFAMSEIVRHSVNAQAVAERRQSAEKEEVENLIRELDLLADSGIIGQEQKRVILAQKHAEYVAKAEQSLRLSLAESQVQTQLDAQSLSRREADVALFKLAHPEIKNDALIGQEIDEKHKHVVYEINKGLEDRLGLQSRTLTHHQIEERELAKLLSGWKDIGREVDKMRLLHLAEVNGPLRQRIRENDLADERESRSISRREEIRRRIEMENPEASTATTQALEESEMNRWRTGFLRQQREILNPAMRLQEMARDLRGVIGGKDGLSERQAAWLLAKDFGSILPQSSGQFSSSYAYGQTDFRTMNPGSPAEQMLASVRSGQLTLMQIEKILARIERARQLN
jgi:hypothetical protein